MWTLRNSSVVCGFLLFGVCAFVDVRTAFISVSISIRGPVGSRRHFETNRFANQLVVQLNSSFG